MSFEEPFEAEQLIENDSESEEAIERKINLGQLRHYDFKDEEINELIRENIDLPQEQWSDDFEKFIELQREEALEELIRIQKEDETDYDVTVEEDIKLGYDKYLCDIHLDEEGLKDKKVLDLGSGKNDFVFYCLENGVSNDVHGADKFERYIERFENWKEKGMSLGEGYLDLFEKYKDNIHDLNYFKDDLPVTGMDHIVSRASVSLYGKNEEKGHVVNLLKKSIDALNDGGEMRICPIFRGFLVSNEDRGDTYNQWQEILAEVCEDTNVSYSFEPVSVHLREDGALLRELLIIKKMVKSG